MKHRPARYLRRGAEAWESLIEEQQAAGLSQAAFCRARGLSLSSFQHWRRRLQGAQPGAGAGRALGELCEQSGDWLELPVGVGVGTSPGWELELDLGGGVCLRLRRR